MRKLLAYLAAFGSLALTCSAQTVTASTYNNWQVYPQSGPYSNTNLIAGANVVSVNPCTFPAPSGSVPVFAASTPIRVVDNGTPSLSEIVTPTAIANGGCTATLTTSNAHTGPYYFKSGTYGLQEAINATALSGQLNSIVMDSAWHQAGGTAVIAYSAAGNTTTTLRDTTIAPFVAYRWNGTHYIQSYAINNIAAPTIAAGAAAGSSPTVSIATGSSGNIMVANVTTGTATTTGTLFTITIGTASPGGGNPNCVAQSVGANNFPVVLTVAGTGTTTFTGAVTVAPAVSTAYVFAISCN